MSSNDWKKTAGQINSATGQNSHDPEIQYYKNEADAFSGKTNLNVPDLGMQPVSGTFLERVAFFGDRVFIVFGFVVCAIFALRAYDNTLVLIQLMSVCHHFGFQF